MKTSATSAVIAALLLTLTACAPHTKYRTVHPDVCISPDVVPSADCEKHALQRLPTGNGNDYLLGFIEFDDQGQLWDRKQMHDVMDTVLAESGRHDLLIVAFVHGWKHSAEPGDANIETFRGALAGLSDAEAYLARTGPARQVVGVYFGWRGGSLTVPILENITFWERKSTAQKVGHGGVTEVLSRLEDIKLTRDSIACQDEPTRIGDEMPCGSNTRFVVVGHSFGGAVVHTAVAQILENRFIQTKGPPGQNSDVAGFGNLVVLINPAFEANLFTPLSNMSVERGAYFRSQTPVMAVLTSEADDATRRAFPIGRWFSTLFEKEGDRERINRATMPAATETISERSANITALGHFRPYRTHRLYPATDIKREALTAVSPAESVRAFTRASNDWVNDEPGKKITFGDVVLERGTNSAGRNPYLVTYVDGALIRDHNDIDDPRVIEFIKQLILISSHNLSQTETIRTQIKDAP